MKKKNRKLGRKYFKNWCEYSRCEFSRGHSPGESLIGGNFPGGSFPDTEENICKEFSSVHALPLIFSRKILILQTLSLHVYSRTNNNFFPMMLKYFLIL